MLVAVSPVCAICKFKVEWTIEISPKPLTQFDSIHTPNQLLDIKSIICSMKKITRNDLWKLNKFNQLCAYENGNHKLKNSTWLINCDKFNWENRSEFDNRMLDLIKLLNYDFIWCFIANCNNDINKYNSIIVGISTQQHCIKCYKKHGKHGKSCLIALEII